MNQNYCLSGRLGPLQYQLGVGLEPKGSGLLWVWGRIKFKNETKRDKEIPKKMKYPTIEEIIRSSKQHKLVSYANNSIKLNWKHPIPSLSRAFHRIYPEIHIYYTYPKSKASAWRRTTFTCWGAPRTTPWSHWQQRPWPPRGKKHKARNSRTR